MSSATSHHGSPAKKQFKKEEEGISQCLFYLSDESSTQMSQNNLAMESALSNFLVLKNIFNFLNDEDVKSCFNVCQKWRGVADPMLFRCYKIILGRWKTFVLHELDPYNRKNLVKYELNFEDASTTLQHVLLTHKIIISLTVVGRIDVQQDTTIKNFLTKFGPHVKDLILVGTISMTLNVFCKFLLERFPNLSNLHGIYLQFDEDSPDEDPDFNPDLPNNKHKQLKRIFLKDCGFESDGSQQLQQILSMASNLEEIHQLSIWLINEVVKKGPLLKSVTSNHCGWGHLDHHGLTSVLAFEKLARLQPQLTSFSLLPSEYYLKGDTSMELFKPFIFSILESSNESLRLLEMVPTEFYGFQNLPPLKALKTLVLTQPKSSSGRSGVGERYFLPEILLPQIFPNVNGIRISLDLTNDWISNFLPESMLSPWGSQIKLFYTQRLHPSSVPPLQRIFPEIEHLEFYGLASEIEEVLPTLAKFWPQLKCLNIFVIFQSESNLNRHSFYRTFRPGILDWALTGLSKEVVEQLLDQSKRENFTVDQIQGFKNQSNICKFKDLKQLTLTLPDGYGWDSCRKEFTSLTHVTDDFGFKLLPDLKVTVGVEIYNIVVKTELEPLTGSSNAKIKDLYLASDLD